MTGGAECWCCRSVDGAAGPAELWLSWIAGGGGGGGAAESDRFGAGVILEGDVGVVRPSRGITRGGTAGAGGVSVSPCPSVGEGAASLCPVSSLVCIIQTE